MQERATTATTPWHHFESSEGWTVQKADNSLVAYCELETHYNEDRPSLAMATPD